MSRRIIYDPLVARQEAAKQLRKLLSSVDMAEVQAQTYATQMVDLLAAMALDMTLKPEDIPVAKFRADMAQAVLNRGYGMPATKSTVTVHRAEDLAPDSKVQADIEAARVAAEEFRQIDRYLQQSMDTWPQWMRDRFAASGTAYQVEDGAA